MLRPALLAVSVLSSCAVLALFSPPALAQRSEIPQIRRPVLVIAQDPGKPLEKVGAKTVDIQVKIVGRLAETRMTLTFGNPHGRALAGDLYLPLPEQATVSGYALDIAGRMVDGVVVEKHEARRIFEREIRKGIDPGLVEWTQGNVFKTRVFPIPANGTRTVRVSWVTPLSGDAASAFYDLPLVFNDSVDLSLRVEVRGSKKPVASGDGPLALVFNEAFVAETKISGKPVVQALRVSLPNVGEAPVQVERGAEGSVWFAIQDIVPVPAAASPEARRVRILWDASLSRATADHKAEHALVRRLLTERFASAEVEVVVVRHEAEPARRFDKGDVAGVIAFLEALPYDGGTQLARLKPAAGSQAVDVQLVFSDGLSTFGNDDPGALGAPTWTISSTIEAAHDALGHLAKRNGGAYFNLGRVSADAIVLGVGRPVFSLLDAKVISGEVADLVPGSAEPVVGPSLVAGRLVSAKATVQVTWGLPGQPAQVTRTYEIDAATAGTGDIVSRAWAERTLSALMASPQRNAIRITALGKTHGIVTPGTSLLVLESLEQYVEYAVRPPASLPDLRAAWDAEIAQEKGALEIAVRDRLTEVAALWASEVEWYEQRFKYPAGFRFRERELMKSESSSSRDGAAFGSAPAAEPSPERAQGGSDDMAEAKKESSGKDGDKSEAPEPGVSMTPWNPQTPYVLALRASSASERMKVYLAQRAEFGTAPSFFLDVSDFFFAEKDPAMALQVLSNVAELRLGEPALLRILGHRLAQLGHFDPSVLAFEEVLRLRPEEPQSYRDLALVLGRRAGAQTATGSQRADYARSLELLAELVKHHWDRFEAIEIMALTELNRLWPAAKESGVASFPLDDRFVKAMELDVRIVMTWDADLTDMDLHVLEPSDEEAYYAHNLTTIGGRVSRDFTQGYGPEVYSVRTAMPGVYKVKTKFFGSSAAQLQGAVTLQVDVFTNWGRKNEKRQSMTLRLTENKEDFVVGEIRF